MDYDSFVHFMQLGAVYWGTHQLKAAPAIPPIPAIPFCLRQTCDPPRMMLQQSDGFSQAEIAEIKDSPASPLP